MSYLDPFITNIDSRIVSVQQYQTSRKFKTASNTLYGFINSNKNDINIEIIVT